MRASPTSEQVLLAGLGTLGTEALASACVGCRGPPCPPASAGRDGGAALGRHFLLAGQSASPIPPPPRAGERSCRPSSCSGCSGPVPLTGLGAQTLPVLGPSACAGGWSQRCPQGCGETPGASVALVDVHRGGNAIGASLLKLLPSSPSCRPSTLEGFSFFLDVCGALSERYESEMNSWACQS